MFCEYIPEGSSFYLLDSLLFSIIMSVVDSTSWKSASVRQSTSVKKKERREKREWDRGRRVGRKIWIAR